MSSILALETSAAVCSVCVDVDGNAFANTEHVERRHNELLLPMAEATMREAGVDRCDISAVAFGCGPGSFTGVRIAAAASQALALALDVPVLPVSSSLALAHAARHAAPGLAPVVTSLRSRADLYYLAAYTGAAHELECVSDDSLCGAMHEVPIPPALLEDTHLLVGNRPAWWSLPRAAGATAVAAAATAIDIATLGRLAFERGEAVDAALALPRYVSGDSPWRHAGAR